jgi:S1-C subfamily serine protease
MLTIGYLVTEAESIWLTSNDGKVIPGHPLAYDFASGLGLVMPLGQLGVPSLTRGTAASIAVGDDAVVIGHGGRVHTLKAQVVGKREFAGFWEYVLDEAIFTTPSHGMERRGAGGHGWPPARHRLAVRAGGRR